MSNTKYSLEEGKVVEQILEAFDKIRAHGMGKITVSISRRNGKKSFLVTESQDHLIKEDA